MFTGIIQTMGRVAGREGRPHGARLVIDPLGWAENPAMGDSVAVSGVCLTRAPGEAAGEEGMLCFDVVGETLARTTLGQWQPGRAVNLEPAMRASDRLGGHFVQGHVDGVGTIRSVKIEGDDWRVRIGVSREFADYLSPKGSIAVDGISLTLAAISTQKPAVAEASKSPPESGEPWFEVALIPTTLKLTTLGQAKAGEQVNLEADIVAKTVVNILRLRGLG